MTLARPAVYLDHNATTPIDGRVLEKMGPFLSSAFGNPASREHPVGWGAAEAVEEARESVAGLINARPGEIFFTSRATESINFALKGLALRWAEKATSPRIKWKRWTRPNARAPTENVSLLDGVPTMTEPEAVAVVRETLLGPNSIPMKLAFRSGIDEEAVKRLEAALDFLADYYRDKEVVSKAVAAALIDLTPDFERTLALYPEKEQEKIVDLKDRIRELAEAVFEEAEPEE
jgi:hypothetical protein